MEKVKLLILFLIFICSCSPSTSNNKYDNDLNGLSENSNREFLRIVSINVWSGLDYKGSLQIGAYEDEETRKLRTQNLIFQLKNINPDIIAVNEANKLPQYALFLADELDYDQIQHVGLGGLRIGPVGLPVNLREGDVLLAKKKFNLQNAGRKQLSGGPVRDFFSFHFTDATQIIGGEITISGRTVFIFNTHWHASPIVTEENNNKLEELLREDKINLNQYDKFLKEALEGQKWRLDESHKTIAFIDEVAGDSPVILLGDFNALAGSDEIKVLTDSGFKDVYGLAGSLPGYTWDGFVNYNIQKQMQMHPQDFLMEPSQKRIDYIFIRGPCLKILSSQVILDGPVNGLFTSDHFGIIAEIELE